MNILKKSFPVRMFSLVFILLTAIFRNSAVIASFPAAGAFMLIPLVVCISMFETEVFASVFGIFAGILWDFSSPFADGIFALCLGLFGLLCSVLCKFFLRRKLSSAFVLGLILLLLAGVAVTFISSADAADRQYMLSVYYFPSAVISSVFIPVYYFIFKFIYSGIKNN